MSDDDFVLFLENKGFIKDESGYLYRKVCNSWLNCDYEYDNYKGLYRYRITVTDDNGEDIYSKKFYFFDDFTQMIEYIIREERFKILLDKDE